MSQPPAGSSGSATGPSLRERLLAARLYLVSDDATPAAELPSVLEAAIAGGVDIFQLRRKGVEPGDLLELAGRCGQVCRQRGILFIVDDWVELARECGADGVHLGQSDMPIADARGLLGEGALIGRSTHNRGHVDEAMSQRADYISAGPVHETPTKPGRPAVGFEHVAVAARRTHVPVVAIGGLGPHEARLALESGADMVAVVRAICSAPDPGAAAARFRQSMLEAVSWPWIFVNGVPRKCRPGEHLGELAAALELAEVGVVVEVNGSILARESWDLVDLHAGDRLEVVHFVGGGCGG
ncbi:MAG: thiamine phosphate synthase [Candidatus Dormibacteria bacterium]